MKISNYETTFQFDFSEIEQIKSDLNTSMKLRTRTEFKFFELGLKAFVSFIRTYSSKNILSNQLFKDLDIMDTINAFCLIRIPQMPELNGKLKGNMDRFEVDETDLVIAKEFKKQLENENLLKPGKSDRRNELNEKLKMRQKLKKMKYKKRREFLSKIDQDELLADYAQIRKAKRKRLSREKKSSSDL